MRTVYIVDHPYPPTSGDLAAAASAGAAEVICGIPPALAREGVSTFGYHEIADPDAPRRLIRKSVVQERAEALGKFADLFALLLSYEGGIHFGRWFAPDWPNVYFDDPAMLTLLDAVGCTSEEIATITAP